MRLTFKRIRDQYHERHQLNMARKEIGYVRVNDNTGEFFWLCLLPPVHNSLWSKQTYGTLDEAKAALKAYAPTYLPTSPTYLTYLPTYLPHLPTYLPTSPAPFAVGWGRNRMSR